MTAATLPYRALALVAGPAHLVDRVVRWPLRQVRLGFLPGGLIAAGVVLLLAGTTAMATLAAYNERPAARPSTLTEIAQGRVSSGLWVAFDGLLVNEPREATVQLFSNGALVGEVERLYYLVRDPADPSQAFLVRSALDPADAVVRTVTARLTDDAAAVAEAISALGDAATGLSVDDTLLLDEHADPSGIDALTAEDGAPLAPSVATSMDPGADVQVTGRIAAQAQAADGSHVYLLADVGGSGAAVLRSPHPPDALPVRLDGTIVSDPFNIGALLDEWQPEERYGELDMSRQRLLALGIGPEFQEPSWWGAVLLGVIGALLLAGTLLGYPVFRGRSATPAPAGGAARPPGVEGEAPQEHAVRIVGTLPTPHGPARLDGEQGKLEWLPVAEVAKTRWRYWGAQLGDLRDQVEAAVRGAGHDAEQLVLHSPVNSVLWPLPTTGRSGDKGDDDDALRAEAGDLFFVRGAAPGIRLQASDANAFLVFRDGRDRDRALSEIAVAR
jgi:hypothetical protein